MRKNKSFSFKPFSEKQRRLMNWWREGSPHADCNMVIADGAVRSGKTIAMICGFFLWSFATFKGETFIMAGKTIGALKKNVIAPALAILNAWGRKYHYVSSGDEARIEVGGNVYYLYDAHNERSRERLQGLTAAGALADEVALFPRSFVEQMIARCSVDGAKLWLNCNPESPAHFVKAELIDKAEQKNIYVLHFRMEDNLALSEKVRQFFRNAFTGVFYRRFILGEWALTDGLVYQDFADDPASYTITEIPRIQYATIGVDFGGTGSAHSFTLTGFTPGFEKVVILSEYYHSNKDGRALNPEQLQNVFVEFVREARKKFNVYEAFCDSAEQTLIRGLQGAVSRAGVAIDVRNARKGPIHDRIMFYNSLIAQGRFYIHSSCKNTIKAMCEAVYNSKNKTEDERLDDGSTNIDSLDSMEYSTESVQAEIIYLGMR